MDRILFVSGSLERGGAQRVLTLLANEYAARGWQVHIALLLHPTVGYALAPSVQVHDLTRPGNYIKNTPFWLVGLRRLYRSLRPERIVSFVGRINLLAMTAALGTGIPLLISERNDPAHDRRSAPERALCKLYYSRADRVVFQTRYQQAFYGNLCRSNACIIGNPIAAPVYTGPHPNGDLISVGKLEKQKNHPLLIRAFAPLAEKYPHIRVHIFGEGSQRQTLQDLIAELGLEGRVLLEGNSDHIFDMLQTYRYFVMTSDYEGLSNALLEAMLSGMTCITTAWPGAEDVVEEGVSGWLTPVGEEEALTCLLDAVLSGQKPDLSAQGQKAALRFLPEHILPLWHQAIEGI